MTRGIYAATNIMLAEEGEDGVIVGQLEGVYSTGVLAITDLVVVSLNNLFFCACKHVV